jgi:hypothetical protein
MKFDRRWILQLSLVHLRYSHCHLGLRDEELRRLPGVLKNQLSSVQDLITASPRVLVLSSVGGEGGPTRRVHFLVNEHGLHHHLGVVVRGACEENLLLAYTRRPKIV